MEKTIQKILFVSLVIVHAQTKRTFLSRLTHFSQNHPVVLFVALLGCFLLVPSISFAAERDTNWFEDGVIWILYWVYVLFSQFVSLAATIFLWVIDSGVFSALMNDTAIYTVWLTVRDFCNIFFILVLLFSAFATIFQLEKYEWKKTLPTLIIMALLVNFSFPISRFVIDLANVPMYFFAQNVSGGANQITGEVLSASKIQGIILPKINSADDAAKNAYVPQMFAAVICMFLFGASFLVLALLMLIRMIALAILVMFSPIGFVGMITPALHKFAHDWWDKLFKWAFYGPISVMLVLVAITVMKAGSDVQASNPMQNLVGADWLSTFISSIAFFTIPIVLFWIAITQAEKYSNDRSGLGIKFGSNMGRKVGGWVRRGSVGAVKLPLKGADNLSGNRISGTALGIREAWRNRQSAWWGGSDIDKRRKTVQEGVSSALRRKGTNTQEVQKKVSEHEKEHTTESVLRDLIKNNNDVAAAMVLAKQGRLTDEEFTKVRAELGVDVKNKPLIDLLEGKVKEKRLDIVMKYRMESDDAKTKIAAKVASGMTADDARDEVYQETAKEEIRKINPSKWKEQNLQDMFGLKDAAGKEIKYTVTRNAAGKVVSINDAATRAVINTSAAHRLRGRISGVQEVFDSFGPGSKNKDKVVDDMNGQNFQAGKDAGLW